MLSQAVGYAATALGCIAAMGGKPVLVREIAETCDFPVAYLAKIINTLAHKGIVHTQRGVHGGVSLCRPAGEVNLYDLCVALEDPAVESRCMLRTAECTDERDCPAHCFWKEHRERQNEFLKRTTVADIAAFETRRHWTQARSRGVS